LFIIVGTIPDDEFKLSFGQLNISESKITISDQSVRINRGTAALASAAISTCLHLGISMPYGLFCGDTGNGNGSTRIYEWLVNNITNIPAKIITFHYIQPDVNLHNMVLNRIKTMSIKPVLIADAGYMYAAKMSGSAPYYDLFTPDIGELAFLADEKAPHPFYTRGFLAQDDSDIETKIQRAFSNNNSSKILLVKGRSDHIADSGKIIRIVSEPCIENMEPIGGTGDTLTGIVSAMIYSGINIAEACISASIANRIAGQIANPTPATRVSEIIAMIPDALKSLSLP
jgi:NAD(P)H-hydrate repair Nnr-like enzyme with NAD(P)H-hydrate dehydratase domain